MNNQLNSTLKKVAEEKYKTARANLLLVVILTAVNMIFAAVGSQSMMLFSATIPYFTFILGLLSASKKLAIIIIGVSLIFLAAYLICWIFSKKHFGWMIAALVMFVADTVFLVALYFLSGDFFGIVDTLIHIWVLFYLILGVVNGVKLKKLKSEEPTDISGEIIEINENNETVNSVYAENTQILRPVDENVKSRILVEGEFDNHKIMFRRAKHTNELVIDGNVYAEHKAVLEFAHTVSADIDGHNYSATYDGISSCIIHVDGNEIARKARLI